MGGRNSVEPLRIIPIKARRSLALPVSVRFNTLVTDYSLYQPPPAPCLAAIGIPD